MGDINFNELAKSAVYDKKSFEELYKNFFPKIYNYVFAKIKNVDEVDDLVSEIFIKVLLNLSTYDDKFAFSTWIFTISSNVVADYFRKSNKIHEESWSEFFDISAPEFDQPENKIIFNENQRELFMAIEKLTERQQKIIELKYLGELSNVEIAELLNLSANNVGYVHFRAINKLRKLLQK